MTAEMNVIDERHPPLKVRNQVDFDFGDVPLHWAAGDAMATHLINSMQMILPEGERWFVRTFKQALPHITDERLRAEAKGFMGQEATHAKAHSPVFEHLRSYGIDTSVVEARIKFLVRRILTEEPPVPGLSRKRWLNLQLAIIAGIEHYTSAMGHWAMNEARIDLPETDPVMLDLVLWHAAEEVEHRSVAFDVYQHVCGSYPLRVVTAFAMLAGLWCSLRMGTGRLIHQDPIVNERAKAKGVKARFSYRAWQHSARRGLVPSPIYLLREAPKYLRRDYHPSKHGNTQQAIDYLLRSPAARAAGYDPY